MQTLLMLAVVLAVIWLTDEIRLLRQVLEADIKLRTERPINMREREHEPDISLWRKPQ